MSQVNTSDKLYIITRQDLSPGLQAAQAVHAITDLIIEFPEKAHDWRIKSNYVVILSVPNKEGLFELAKKLIKLPVPWTLFREPDINDELTAIAVLPNGYSKELFSNLPLALKEVTQK